MKSGTVGGTEDRQKDTDRQQVGCGRFRTGPSQSCLMCMEMAVTRRHARPSVKLETSGAQLSPTKSLPVRTSLLSHVKE